MNPTPYRKITWKVFAAQSVQVSVSRMEWVTPHKPGMPHGIYAGDYRSVLVFIKPRLQREDFDLLNMQRAFETRLGREVRIAIIVDEANSADIERFVDEGIFVYVREPGRSFANWSDEEKW